MFKLSRPTQSDIDQYLKNQLNSPFTYEHKDVGMTQSRPLPIPDRDIASARAGYTCDHNRILLGHGESIYKEAVKAIRNWHQFDLGWVRVAKPDTPIAHNEVVCLTVNLFLIWALFACRIVYVIDEEKSPIKRFGLAYGTLPGHPESGEERFSIEWNDADDSVWYDILAYSRPGNPFIALGFPFARIMQKRFAKNSMKVMAGKIAQKNH